MISDNDDRVGTCIDNVVRQNVQESLQPIARRDQVESTCFVRMIMFFATFQCGDSTTKLTDQSGHFARPKCQSRVCSGTRCRVATFDDIQSAHLPASASRFLAKLDALETNPTSVPRRSDWIATMTFAFSRSNTCLAGLPSNFLVAARIASPLTPS